MELAVSKIGQKVSHGFVLRYKNMKIVNSVQVQVALTCEGVNILSTHRLIKIHNLGDKKNGGFFKTDSIYLNLIKTY